MLCLFIDFMMTFKFIWNYIKKYKWLYIAGIATLFVVDYSSLFIPRLTGVITDGLSNGSFTMRDVIRCLFEILFFGFVMTLGRVGWRFFFMGTSRSVEKDLRNDIFSHLTLMSTRFFQTHGSGDLMSRFTNDLSCIRQAIGPAVISLFDGTVMTVMVLCQMIFYVNWKLTALTMIPMVLIAIGVVYYGRLMHRLYDDRQVAISSLTDYARESFTGIRVVKSFVREQFRMVEFAKENKNTRDKTLRTNYMMALMMPLLDLVIELSILITLIYGGYLTINGDISLGRFVAYNQYIIMLIWPMIACGDAVNSFSQGAASISRIREILEIEPEIVDEKEVVDIPYEEDASIQNFDIEIKELDFSYPDRDDFGLHNINISAKTGKCLAITGRTGCGKTTIADLLLHVFQVNDGHIFVGGKDINQISIKQLRRMIAYVPQDDFLFSDTIYNNIIFGTDAESDMATVVKMTQAACVHDSIEEFTDGYNTWVGERGVTLSGGQKQRICIARALIRNAPILILDDALSAVDTDTERNLLTNIMEFRKDKTTIIIAHRITTISHGDTIVVIDSGSVVQSGDHNSLIEQTGPYRELYEHQQLEDECKDFLG